MLVCYKLPGSYIIMTKRVPCEYNVTVLDCVFEDRAIAQYLSAGLMGDYLARSAWPCAQLNTNKKHHTLGTVVTISQIAIKHVQYVSDFVQKEGSSKGHVWNAINL